MAKKKIVVDGNYKERLQIYKKSLELLMKQAVSNVIHDNSRIRGIKENIENHNKYYRAHLMELKRVKKELSRLK